MSHPKPSANSSTVPALKVQRAAQAYGQTKPQKEPRWDLVEQYLPLLKSIVGRMRIFFPSYMDVQDIYSIALAGLISASQLYDETKGAAFGSYAKVRIRGALMDEMRRMDWLARTDRADVKRYRKAVEALQSEFKDEVTDAQICAKLQISPKENERLKGLMQPLYLLPLDASSSQSSEGETPSFHEMIPDLTQMDARDVLEGRDMRALLRQGLKHLPESAQKVLVLYYLEGLNLAEIAEVLSLSESRICQIHSKAITDLRTYLLNQN